MARTATAAKAANEKQVVKTAKTTTGALDDLSSLASVVAGLEGTQRAQSIGGHNFLTLCTKLSKAIDEDSPAHVPGAKVLDYVIPSQKLKLGKEVDVTILGMFKVYAEMTPKVRDSDIPKTVSFWMPDEAAQFPITDGYFGRKIPEGFPGAGNVLHPQHWVFLYLHDHPEMENVILSFRSVGNKFYKELEKLVNAESSLCTELRFNLTNQKLRNEAYDKTDYYPKFEIAGRNFEFVGGKVTKATDKQMVAELLTLSKELYDSYNGCRMVSRKNLQALPAPRKAVEAYIDDDSEVDTGRKVKF